MDGAVEAASDFFKLPSEVKEEFASDDLRQPVRYDTSSKDGISMSRAFLKHYAHPLSDWVQYWPEDPAIILLTSCRGLEVVDRNSNSWKVVQQLPHALHVHVGDHMEVLSNGRIKTVVHRALLNPEEERISIASINGCALYQTREPLNALQGCARRRDRRRSRRSGSGGCSLGSRRRRTVSPEDLAVGC